MRPKVMARGGMVCSRAQTDLCFGISKSLVWAREQYLSIVITSLVGSNHHGGTWSETATEQGIIADTTVVLIAHGLDPNKH